MKLRSPSSVSLSVKFTDASLGALMPNMPLTSGSVFPPALLCRPHFSHSPWSPGPTLLSHSHSQSANLVLKEGRCEVSLGGSRGGGGGARGTSQQVACHLGRYPRIPQRGLRFQTREETQVETDLGKTLESEQTGRCSMTLLPGCNAGCFFHHV